MTGDEIKEKLAFLRTERERWKVKAEGGKVSVVGVFGKLGSSYSSLYSPDLLIAVTLTGQLSSLMLIERAERIGVEVISANTDGITFFCPKDKEEELKRIIVEWEELTGLQIERTDYRALHNASVNSYVAVKTDGKTKVKGPLADPWSEGDLRGQMSKNPQMTIVSEAITKYLAYEVPIEDTILACSDPRKIVTIIRVAKGGEWRGTKLGRTVRYYWSTDGEPITYTGDGRRVAKTEGAKPLMELTDRMPPDVDFARYIAEAKKALVDLGVGGGSETTNTGIL